jgi:hypothetical protein
MGGAYMPALSVEEELTVGQAVRPGWSNDCRGKFRLCIASLAIMRNIYLGLPIYMEKSKRQTFACLKERQRVERKAFIKGRQRCPHQGSSTSYPDLCNGMFLILQRFYVMKLAIYMRCCFWWAQQENEK